MREIKAFVRVNMVDKVLQALEAVGIDNITVIDVRAIWTGRESPRGLHYSLDLAERYMNVAKVETVVRDQDAERVIALIRTAGRTGRSGDGVVYATPVERYVHIRSGLEDDRALPAH